MKRSITHWTAGGGRASSVDLEHYHYLTEFDGNYVKGHEDIKDNMVTSDGDYAAHTLHLNTGSMGLAMCGMRGAKENPFDAGPSPLNEVQFESHCNLVASKHIEYGVPINEKTCLTHAEVEPRLGVKQRGKWDLTRLPFKPGLRGAFEVGDYFRARVKYHASRMNGAATLEVDLPTLRVGSRGKFVTDLQTQLRDLGYALGHTEGVYGDRTRDAVMAFQADNDLTSDGIMGPNSWVALDKAEPRTLRNVTEKDLEVRGSKTIQKSKKVEKAMTSAETTVAGGLTVGGAIELAKSAKQAEGALEMGQRLLVQYWPILLACAAVFVIARYGKKILREIREARVADAQTGRNLSR